MAVLADRLHASTDRLYYGTDTRAAALLTGAAGKGFVIIVRELLKHGADPTLPNDAGVLPADVARQAGFPKIAEMLSSAASKTE